MELATIHSIYIEMNINIVTSMAIDFPSKDKEAL